MHCVTPATWADSIFINLLEQTVHAAESATVMSGVDERSGRPP